MENNGRRGSLSRQGVVWKLGRFVVLWAVLLGTMAIPGIVITPALAQKVTIQTVPAIDGLIKDGIAALRAGNIEGAQKIFEEATRKAAADPRGWFFKGMALNRLGAFRVAMRSLLRARALGFKPPQIDFEMGWASLNIGLFKPTILHLSAFEKASPGSAKTSEFLGRAYFALKQYDRAEKHLREAIARDPKTRATALLYLARLQKARGDKGQASKTLAEIITGSPNTGVGRNLRETLNKRLTERPAPTTKKAPAKKPWFATIAISGGYNDNVVGQPDNFALPADISSQSSYFARTTLDTGYRRPLGGNAALNAGYSLSADTYASLGRFNALSHAAYVEYQRRLKNDVIGGIRVFGDWAYTDLDTTRNRIGLTPSVAYRWDHGMVTEASYAVGINNYFADVAQVLDRDGATHTFGLAHHIRDATPFDVNVSLGFNHVINSADGDDFDFESNAVFLSLNRELPWKIRGGLSYIFSRDRYDDPNSQSAFVFNRRDNIHLLTLQFSRPLTFPAINEVEVFGRYSYSNYNSNIAVFTFDQNVINLGLIKRF